MPLRGSLRQRDRLRGETRERDQGRSRGHGHRQEVAEEWSEHQRSGQLFSSPSCSSSWLEVPLQPCLPLGKM